MVDFKIHKLLWMWLFKGDKHTTASKLQQQVVILIAEDAGLAWQLFRNQSVLSSPCMIDELLM